MVQSEKCAASLQAWRDKQAYKKSKRLITASDYSPSQRQQLLNKCEYYMKAQAYEDYIDRFLNIEEEDHTPDIDQAKIAVQMYDKKKKYSTGETNPLLEEA